MSRPHSRNTSATPRRTNRQATIAMDHKAGPVPEWNPKFEHGRLTPRGPMPLVHSASNGFPMGQPLRAHLREANPQTLPRAL